ncbi:MAG: hypothetical protein JO110_11715 [Acetobacteraceae bacterium]|nr:hypothetical protein [Acetobacteraceae bacterium]
MHRLGLTLAGLREALAARMAKDRTNVPLLFLAWTRLRRLAVRFEALVADFRAGRLWAARSVCGTAENLRQPPNLPGLPPPFRAPRNSGWLLRLAPESAAFAGQVKHLLADPEMKALLAGSAQAGRMLRPLCGMLGIEAGLEPSPRRGAGASPAEGVGLGDAAAAAPVAPDALPGSGSEPRTDCPPRAIAPASPAAIPPASSPAIPPASSPAIPPAPPGGSGFASSVGAGAGPWPAELGLLVRTSENAGGDPPPAVSWRRAEPG